MKFDADKITDAKRLVRGEHWLAVRTHLRRRDATSVKPWRIATLAGGAPAGEIRTIRGLMCKAHIIAMDVDEACLCAAIDAGADEVAHVDVLDFPNQEPKPRDWAERLPTAFPREIDALNLDFCGPVSPLLGEAVRRYTRAFPKAPVMATFSYGRDVAELYPDREYRGVPAPLAGRLRALDRNVTHSRYLASVIRYKGNAMPMVSVLWLPPDPILSFAQRQKTPGFIYETVGDDDLELAVAYPDVGDLYDLPADRIRGFRARAAALKAVATKRARESDALREQHSGA